MNLENVLDLAISKEQEQNQKYINQLKNDWEQMRIGANFVFEKLSFLEKRGVKIKKLNDTDFNYSQASNGYFPDVRIENLGIIIIKKCGNDGDEINVSGLGLFPLRGEKHTFESFLKKIAAYFK